MKTPSHPSQVLAFDTSTEFMSVALCTSAGHWLAGEEGGQRASARLIPVIESLMKQAGCTWPALDAVAFGRGPGAFTGLRTACSVAQGLALGAAKPVLALDTLMVVAQETATMQEWSTTSPATHSVWVVMDARMNEIYAAHYQWSAGQWSTVVEPHLSGVGELNQRWLHAPAHTVAGSALLAFGEQLQTGLAARLPQAWPSARALLPLAQQAWERGETKHAMHAVPLYLRDKVALTTAERYAAQAPVQR